MIETSCIYREVLTKKSFMYTTKQQSLADITKPIKKSKCTGERNTFRVEYEDGSIAYRLHKTDVVTIDGNGYVLNSGGWRTVTTKERISAYLPQGWYLSQCNGVWYVTTPKGRFDYYDGMRIATDGTVKKVKHTDLKKIETLKKKIKNFVNKIDKMKEIPLPNSGDCWYCSLHTQDGKTMGDSFENNDHIMQHLKEGYLHGSLIVNALKDSGYRDMQIPYVIRIKDIVKRALRKYLQKKLIPNIQVK
jgi:hypothetical protein